MTAEDISSHFFHWMDENNITRKQGAEMLGVEERSLSSYRSRGLPKKKQARALKIMREWKARESGARPDESLLRISWTDEELEIIASAARVVDTPLTDFIKRATIHRARADMRLDRDKR
jgi:hypothetical protein